MTKRDYRAVQKGHTGYLYSISFSADGKLLASGGEDKTVRLRNPTTYECVATLGGHDDAVKRVVFRPNLV
jgi:WD40 repeat protein